MSWKKRYVEISKVEDIMEGDFISYESMGTRSYGVVQKVTYNRVWAFWSRDKETAIARKDWNEDEHHITYLDYNTSYLVKREIE